MDKQKRNFLLISGLSFLSIAAITVGAMGGNSVEKLFGAVNSDCTVCSGNHYSAKLWDGTVVGKTNTGHYEYWVCCRCHKSYLSTNEITGGYNSSKWVDKTETSADFNYADYTDKRIQFGGSNKAYNVNKLTEGTSLTIDGQRDDAYNSANKYSFSTNVKDTDTGCEKSTLTATLEPLWQGTMLYIYVDVNDPTKNTRDFTKCEKTDSNTEANDCVELRIDTLHSAQYATADWDGQWGGSYRGSYACEGWFKVAAGYEESDQFKSKGCEFTFDGYLSNLSQGDNKTYIKSHYIDETHYGMEFAICLSPKENAIMNPFNEIGIAMKIWDRNTTGGVAGIINFEDIGYDYAKPRLFSNFRLVG